MLDVEPRPLPSGDRPTTRAYRTRLQAACAPARSASAAAAVRSVPFAAARCSSSWSVSASTATYSRTSVPSAGRSARSVAAVSSSSSSSPDAISSSAWLHHPRLAIPAVATDLRDARLPRGAHMPSTRIGGLGIEHNSEDPAAVRRTDHQHQSRPTRPWFRDHDAIAVDPQPRRYALPGWGILVIGCGEKTTIARIDGVVEFGAQE